MLRSQPAKHSFQFWSKARTRNVSRTTSRPRRNAARGDVKIDEVGVEAKMPWEADGRRWHTQGPRQPQRRPLSLGGAGSGRSRRPDRRVRRLQPHRLVEPRHGRNPRQEEIARLVLPCDHRRRVAAEDEIPHDAQHVQGTRPDRTARPQAVQRPARAAPLRQPPARPLRQPPRAVAGGGTEGLRLRRDRPRGVLEVRRRSGSPVSASSPKRPNRNPKT